MIAASTPLTLQIGLRIRGSREGSLADGDTVMKGDRIQVLAQTTEDAHLYLAYCTANRELTVFPMQGSILVPAGAITVAPGKETYLLLDDHDGSEALYVILSRVDLRGPIRGLRRRSRPYSRVSQLRIAARASRRW